MYILFACTLSDFRPLSKKKKFAKNSYIYNFFLFYFLVPKLIFQNKIIIQQWDTKPEKRYYYGSGSQILGIRISMQPTRRTHVTEWQLLPFFFFSFLSCKWVERKMSLLAFKLNYFSTKLCQTGLNFPLLLRGSMASSRNVSTHTSVTRTT